MREDGALQQTISEITGDTDPVDLTRAKRALLRELLRAHLGALSSPSWRVRKKAARALGELGPDASDALLVLEDSLKDEHPGVRQAAAAAIIKVRG